MWLVGPMNPRKLGRRERVAISGRAASFSRSQTLIAPPGIVPAKYLTSGRKGRSKEDFIEFKNTLAILETGALAPRDAVLPVQDDDRLAVRRERPRLHGER